MANFLTFSEFSIIQLATDHIRIIRYTCIRLRLLASVCSLAAATVLAVGRQRKTRQVGKMRWYGLHPELPEQAVLRIRTAPDSAADECGRVAKGQALSVVSRPFEMKQEDDLPSQTWLQVSLPAADPDAPAVGFVMASLPDGMKLLVPWEQIGTWLCV